MTCHVNSLKETNVISQPTQDPPKNMFFDTKPYQEKTRFIV